MYKIIKKFLSVNLHVVQVDRQEEIKRWLKTRERKYTPQQASSKRRTIICLSKHYK